jgi:plastocyanin
MMNRCVSLMVGLAVAGAWLLGGGVLTADAQTEIGLTIENNRFQPEEIKVKGGAPFVLVITNKDKGPEEFESHDLRIEKVIPAGKTVRLKIPALKPGTYRFVGEYHEQTAKGRIIAE